MDIASAAAALKELGHQTRLAIYKELVRAGPGDYLWVICRRVFKSLRLP